MQENFFNHFNASDIRQTPKSVKNLITTLVITSLLSPILTFFLHYFQLLGPQDFLPLSLPFLHYHYYFEWLTYPFVHSLESAITLSSLLSLTFQICLFWFSASEISRHCGQKKLLWLFFSTSLFTGVLTSLLLFLTQSSLVLYGIQPILSSFFMIWLMIKKEESLSLFLFFKVKAKTLVFAFFALLFFMNLTGGEYLHFFANLMGVLYGMLFGHWFLKLSSPLPFSQGKEKAPPKPKHSADIIDITSVSEDPDDRFMDEMLDKISKVGREGLTRAEKMRMDEIVKRRRPPQ